MIMQVTVTTLSLSSLVALLSLILVFSVCVFTWVFKVERKLAVLCNELSHIRDVLKEMKHFSDLIND